MTDTDTRAETAGYLVGPDPGEPAWEFWRELNDEGDQ